MCEEGLCVDCRVAHTCPVPLCVRAAHRCTAAPLCTAASALLSRPQPCTLLMCASSSYCLLVLTQGSD